MRCLGRHGRFGNQIFQYAFLKIYAKEHGLAVEAPEWVGRQLFGRDDPYLNGRCRNVSINKRNFDWYDFEHDVDINLKGYFLYHTSDYARHKEYFRSLFEPVEKPQVPEARFLVGIHLRRGDYVGKRAIVPEEWYEKWLKKFKNYVLYVASDDPEMYKRFPGSLHGNDWWQDFYILTQCNALAISNSTFSFAASMLNRKAEVFMRPDYEKKELVRYDPWNSWPMIWDV